MIPVNRPSVPKNAARYLRQCVRSGWFSSEGPFVREFENAFSSYIGMPHAAAASSGTASLHLAVLALDIGPGDEVIVPALTIGSCYFAVWQTGAKAVPVDIDPDIYAINPSLIERAITHRTKAIMIVHLFGHPADMDPIMKIADKHKLPVIEDAAEAHGAEYKRRRVGSIGDISIFSFYANKIVTSGEGGMVLSKDPNIIEKVRRLRSLNHSSTRFIHQGIGYNYLMSNMQAALGLASLEEIDESIHHKRTMAQLYTTSLKNLPGLTLPVEKPWAKNVYWMYAVRTNTESAKRKIVDNLIAREIQTRTFFYDPKSAFPFKKSFRRLSFPVAQLCARTGFYLPSGLGNTRREFFAVSRAIHSVFQK